MEVNGTEQSQLSVVVAALTDGRSVVLSGAPGVGKSWLAASVASHLTDADVGTSNVWHVEHLIGTPAVAEVAFSAVGHLLPTKAMPASELLVASVLNQLAERAGGRPSLLLVDDLDQLDVGSAAVVHQFQAQAGMVLATVRNGRLDAPGVAALANRSTVDQIERIALTNAELGALVDGAVGGATSARLRNELWRLSAGNPYVALSVLGEARAGGSLQLDDRGCWDADVTKAEFNDVEGHLGVRLSGLGDAAERALELIAIAEPMPLEWAIRLGIDHIATQLEDLGLVIAEAAGDTFHLRGAHPLISERVRARQAPLRRRARLGELTRCLADPNVDLGSPGLVRTALWAREGSVALAPDVAGAAVTSAMSLFDLEAASVLIAQISPGDRELPVCIAAGKVAALSGDPKGFAEAFARAFELADNERDRARVVIAQSELQLFVLGDEETALAALSSTLEETTDVAARAEMAATLTLTFGMAGDFTPALGVAEELLEQGDVPPEAELTLLIGNGVAHAMVGTTHDLTSRVERADRLAHEFGDVNPNAGEQVDLIRSMLAMADARMGDAQDLVDTAAGRRSRAGRPSGSLTMAQSTMRLVAGRDDGMIECGNRALVLLDGFDPLGIRAIAVSCLAIGAVCGGRLDDARELMDLGWAERAAEQPRSAVWLDRAENWILNDTDPLAAAEQARSASERAVEHSHVVWGSLAAHDAVRFGHAELVDELLSDLVDASSKCPLVVLFSRHASAVVAEDVHALEAVAGDFASAGLRSSAVSALVHAAELATAQGNAAASMRLATMAHRAAGPVVGELVPELARHPRPLSSRELDVVELAATGMTNRDVAEQLFLSPRTVENHLGRVYSRLGIHSRDELAAVMVPPA